MHTWWWRNRKKWVSSWATIHREKFDAIKRSIVAGTSTLPPSRRRFCYVVVPGVALRGLYQGCRLVATLWPLLNYYSTSSELTMCDFHNFGLIFAGQMLCLPQRLKSTLFEIFLNGGTSLCTAKKQILSRLFPHSAISCQRLGKIMFFPKIPCCALVRKIIKNNNKQSNFDFT